MAKKEPKKNKVGRPSKKDSEDFDAVRKLLAAFWRGANITEACVYAGISRETYYKWCREMPELSDNFDVARTKVSENAKTIVVAAIDNGDINAAKWWLERKNKKEFGPNAEDTFDELSNEEIAEEKLQAKITEGIADKYRVWLFYKREELLAEYSKKNEYLICRIDKLLKLPNKELAEYADFELRATGADKAGVKRLLIIRMGGENYKDLINLVEETEQQYKSRKEANESQQDPNAGKKP